LKVEVKVTSVLATNVLAGISTGTNNADSKAKFAGLENERRITSFNFISFVRFKSYAFASGLTVTVIPSCVSSEEEVVTGKPRNGIIVVVSE